MLVLYLLRHAKSSWDDASQPDFERPLTNRGREACALIAEVIQEKGIEFDLILVSTAVRTRQTIEIVKEHAKILGEVRYDERIYDATVTQLLEVISEVENDRKSVLLVGHNPGIEELVTFLTGEQVRVTTANVAKIKMQASNKGTLDWIIRPKEM